MIAGVRRDLAYGWRLLLRKPAYALVAVLTLGIGIGSTTTIFSVVDATLLAALPFHEADRLVKVDLTRLPARDYVPWSYPKYEVYRSIQGVFGSLALYRGASTTLSGAGEAEIVRVERVTSSYFQVLGVQAAVGRTLTADHDRPGAAAAVTLLGHDLWMQRFAGDRAIIGRTITLGADPVTVIGIMPRGFRGLTLADVWMPVASMGAGALQTSVHRWDLVGRLAPGVSVARAAADVARAGARLGRAFPTPNQPGTWGATSYTLNQGRVGPQMRRAVLVLFGAVLLVLLVACANIANLLLARTTEREQEYAVRAALGAGPGLLARQAIVESALLAVAGGLLGTAVACAAVALVARTAPMLAAVGGPMPAMTELAVGRIGLDARALLFTTLVTLATVGVFGLAPAIRSARTGFAGLGGAGRRMTAAGSAGLFRFKSLLVVGEVALSLVLLAGAGLLGTSLVRLLRTDVGIDAAQVATLRVRLEPKQYDEAAATDWHTRLAARLGTLPGVASTSLASCLPLSGGCHTTTVGPDLAIGLHWVSPTHFATLRIPLRRGRLFTEDDRAAGSPVVVVSETAARRLWPGEDPLGKRLALDDLRGGSAEVVGVVGDVRYVSVEERPEPDVYLSLRQSPQAFLVVFVRTVIDPTRVASAIRLEVQALDRSVAIRELSPLSEQVGRAVASTRFVTALVAVFACVALGLAGVGLYGVMSCLVSQRTREIGLRMALGADPHAVRLLVLRHAAGLTGAGIVLGTLGALAASRVIASLLYEVDTTDPLVHVSTAALLGAIALAASYAPVRRATSVSPLVAMRGD